VSPYAVALYYLVLGGGGALLAYFALGVNPLHPLAAEADLLRDVALGVGIGLVVVAASRLLDRWFEWSRAMSRQFKEILGAIRPIDTAVIAIASSVGEELLFRGFLLPWLGLVASSVIFGVVHGFSPGPPAHMLATLRKFMPLVIAATVMGFAFAWTVEYTGNLLAAIVAHFTINFLNLNEMYREDWESGRSGGSHG
jgi:membrane protease YdiL (CAAX protease family)